MDERPMRPGDSPDLEYAYDLAGDDMRRRHAVLEALGDQWDPAAAVAGEEMAYQMLFCALDDEQQTIYEELVRARVLPDRR